MDSSSCLNCNPPFDPLDKFCSHCGQTTNTHRFTPAHFVHEFFHAFIHTDKSIFHLLKSLAMRPGSTARDYLVGKRARYFNPFTFFLLLMGLFVFSNNYFAPKNSSVTADPRVIERIPTVKARNEYVQTMKRVKDATNVFTKNGNLVAMVAIPFISLFTWVFFRKRGFNFTEHLTANMMFVAFSNLIFSLVVFPLARRGGVGGGMHLVALALQVLYFGWALNGLLQLVRLKDRLKSFSVCFLAILLWTVCSMTIMAVYIYQSWDFYKFFFRMGGR